MAPAYRPTHIPYGMLDESKRLIINPTFKDEVHFKQYGIETGGAQFCVSVLVKGGGGVPIHKHITYGETFRPTRGELGVVGHNGTKTMILRPAASSSEGHADTYTVKPGELHRFFNPSATEDIDFDTEVRPAHEGFEKALHIVYGLARDGLADAEGLPKSWFHALLFLSMGEMRLPGWSGWVSGTIADWVRWVAWITGEEETLLRKYYGRPITASELKEWEKTAKVTIKND